MSSYELLADRRAAGCVAERRAHHKATVALREKDKKVLLLGAGYVSAPVVDYITRDKHISVTVGNVADCLEPVIISVIIYM